MDQKKIRLNLPKRAEDISHEILESQLKVPQLLSEMVEILDDIENSMKIFAWYIEEKAKEDGKVIPYANEENE